MSKILDVIKYEGDNQTFVWKHYCEDFNTNSQLIVHETQEAILFVNGQMCDSFGPGKHTLEVENIPILRKIINIPSGGISQFHCEVYFVNLVEHMAIRWGTDSKVQYMDPEYNFPLSIGANGEMSLSVEKPRTLLRRLVGTEILLNRNTLVSYFRSVLMSTLKTHIASQIKSQRINIFELDENITSFSKKIKELLTSDFLNYGIKLNLFNITGFAKPEGDPIYEKFKLLYFRQFADVAEAKLKKNVEIINQETEKEKLIIEAEGFARKRKIEGYTYQQERGFDIAEKVAENEGVANLTNLGVGLGVMSGVGNHIGNIFTETISNTNQNYPRKFCEECGHELIIGMKFCENCGYKVEMNNVCSCGYKFVRQSKFCPGCGKKCGE